MRVQLPNGAPIVCRISSKVEPAIDNREALVRFQHPAPFSCKAWVTGRDGRCTRLLSETRLVRFQRHPPEFAGLADRDMHSPFKRDEVGSIPSALTSFQSVSRLSLPFPCRSGPNAQPARALPPCPPCVPIHTDS